MTPSLRLALFAVGAFPWAGALPCQTFSSSGPLHSVLIDRPGDGQTWVLAPGYKARFGGHGVDYIPYFGPRAPRNFPLSFRLRSVRRGDQQLPWRAEVSPNVEGRRITFDRGVVLEHWDLRAHEVEQSFDIAVSAGGGDLVVELAVSTDLRADASDGLQFAAAGLGAVRYGDLVAFDRTGHSMHAPARWLGDAVELRLPAAFVTDAGGSITIDPLITTLSLDAGSDDCLGPDVAYEPSTDRYLVVYERVFSARDSDIIARRYNPTGGLIEEVAVATGTRESHHPSVGANVMARQFLVAWDEDQGIADRVVLGRTRDAASTTQGNTIPIVDSAGLTVIDVDPDVGGSSATSFRSDLYCVVCESQDTNVLGNAKDINVRLVATNGTVPFAGQANLPSVQAADPAVSSDRRNGSWLIVYRALTGALAEIRATEWSAGNALVASQIVQQLGNNGPPAVAGDGNDWLVTWAHTVTAGDQDLEAGQLHSVNGALSVLQVFDLTRREPGAVTRNDQKDPCLGYDGCRYTYCYLESSGTAGNDDAYAASFQFDAAGNTVFADAHRALHTGSNAIERRPRIATNGELGGDAGLHLSVWDVELSSSNHDIQGARYLGTAVTGGITTLATACGLVPPNLRAENPPALGATVRLRADAFQPQNQVMLVGLPVPPITLCSQGCKLGVSPILLSVPGIALDLPIPCDPRFLGAQVAAQNAVLANFGGCTAANFILAVVVTDTLVLTVQ